jgi:hypothetical protein
VASPKNDDVVMNIMSTCMQDEQDFVRLYMVDACTKYLKTEGTQVSIEKSLNLFEIIEFS